MSRRHNKKQSYSLDEYSEADDIQEKLSSGIYNENNKKQLIRSIIGKKPGIQYKNNAQRDFSNLIDDKEIIFASGPAGVGKSMISIFKAIQLIYSSQTKYENIVIIKPIVEADEKLGFLPGNVEDKISQYQYSSICLIEKILGKSKCQQLIDNDIVQGQALAYMRGNNIDKSILILEEAQNTTKRQMLTVLTRIGEDSKFIISGDEMQSDRFMDPKSCGLVDAIQRLNDLDNIGVFKFGSKDVVRNPIIQTIIKRYEDS